MIGEQGLEIIEPADEDARTIRIEVVVEGALALDGGRSRSPWRARFRKGATQAVRLPEPEVSRRQVDQQRHVGLQDRSADLLNAR
jgi:hypothetical protein